MAYVPFAQETGAVYTLTSPTGAVAVVFNDPASASYGGMLAEISGLDSAEVRESATDLVESDGGVHGRFYFGRRPITMTVKVFSHATALERATKIDRIHRAAQGLRGDSILKWSPTYAPSTGLQVPVRLQQPIRDSGPWAKDIQLPLVSATAVIVGQTLRTSGAIASGGSLSLENQGSYPAYPLIQITGASTNPWISDNNGGILYTGPAGYTLSLVAGETIEIDTLAHTAKFIAGARTGQRADRFIDFGNTLIWPRLQTGTQAVSFSGGGSAVVVWRDTWH